MRTMGLGGFGHDWSKERLLELEKGHGLMNFERTAPLFSLHALLRRGVKRN